MSLEIVNLTKKISFKKEEIVLFDQLNISFPEYGMIGIFGESGCGKTTLLHLIAGLDRQYEGKILINQKNIIDLPYYNRDYIAMIYQDYRLFDFLNVYENCVMYNRIKGTVFSKREADELLTVFGLEKFKNKKLKDLSGGQKQRVAIVRALLSHCPIILCDEPTGALNEANRQQVYRYLKKYSRNHLIIMVSHDQKAIAYCDYFIDFQHLHHHYVFSWSKYHKYYFECIHRRSLLLKESLKMLYFQKNKLMMIFFSQIYIFLTMTLLITGITGLNAYYTDLQANTINNNLIFVTRKNKQPFTVQEMEELHLNYQYFLDIGTIKGLDFFLSSPIEENLQRHEIIVNEAFYEKIKQKKITYGINEQSFSFVIRQVIRDDYEEPVIYYGDKTLTDDLKLMTIDVSTGYRYVKSYHDVSTWIACLSDEYEGYCLIAERFQAYDQLMTLCQTVCLVFIIIGAMIVIVLMLFILLSMFFELQKYYIVFLSNGMSLKQFYFFLLRKIWIICFHNAVISSLCCFMAIKMTDICDISDRVLGIPHIFQYPTLFFYDYDIYIVYVLGYFLIGILLFGMMSIQLKRINMIAILREE